VGGATLRLRPSLFGLKDAGQAATRAGTQIIGHHRGALDSNRGPLGEISREVGYHKRSPELGKVRLLTPTEPRSAQGCILTPMHG
jgi:hypothetical protein